MKFVEAQIPKFKEEGYFLRQGIFGGDAIAQFREESNRLAAAEESACVRHIRDKSELFNRLAVLPELLEMIAPGQVPVRSILFDKTAAENWPVPWHQDLTIAVKKQEPAAGYGPWSVKDGVVHVQPPVELLRRMVTLRIHLDPTPDENGALRVLPKTHRLGKIPSDDVPRHVDDSAFTCACQPGDVLLMSPLILHSSRKAVRPDRRRVLHFEYAFPDDLDDRLKWNEESQMGA